LCRSFRRAPFFLSPARRRNATERRPRPGTIPAGYRTDRPRRHLRGDAGSAFGTIRMRGAALVHRLANTLAFERRCRGPAPRSSFVALLATRGTLLIISAKNPGVSPPSLSRAPQHGAAHRRSRCVKLFTRRYTSIVLCADGSREQECGQIMADRRCEGKPPDYQALRFVITVSYSADARRRFPPGARGRSGGFL